MRLQRWWVGLAALLTVHTAPGWAAENAAETTFVYPCLPAPATITIDGKLTPMEWGHTVEAAGFTVSGSDTLAPEPVLMRLTYDTKRLYLGITCMESNMKGLKTGGAGQRDGAFWFDDSIEFFVNSSHDHESYQQFAVTAKGILYDNLQGDATWDADWKAATTQAEDRWTVEISVALADLATKPPTAGTLWGFNLCRERQAGGKLELFNWANVQRVFNRADLFGHIAFVQKDWQATAETVRQAVRDADGEKSRSFVQNGAWVTPTGGTPAFLSFLEKLREQDTACPPFIAKLESMYAANPTLPNHEPFGKIAADYAAIKAAIADNKPLLAQTFDRHALRLSLLQSESEDLYWRVKLAELNLTME